MFCDRYLIYHIQAVLCVEYLIIAFWTTQSPQVLGCCVRYCSPIRVLVFCLRNASTDRCVSTLNFFLLWASNIFCKQITNKVLILAAFSHFCFSFMSYLISVSICELDWDSADAPWRRLWPTCDVSSKGWRPWPYFNRNYQEASAAMCGLFCFVQTCGWTFWVINNCLPWPSTVFEE